MHGASRLESGKVYGYRKIGSNEKAFEYSK